MKKLITVLLVLFVAGFAFAQDATANAGEAVSAERTVQVVVPENQHTTDVTASVRIEYRPMYDDARVYYTCRYVTYQKDEAMTAVRDCLNDFLEANQYKHYTYLARDREHYFKNDKGVNTAEYMSYVKLIR